MAHISDSSNGQNTGAIIFLVFLMVVAIGIFFLIRAEKRHENQISQWCGAHHYDVIASRDGAMCMERITRRVIFPEGQW